MRARRGTGGGAGGVGKGGLGGEGRAHNEGPLPCREQQLALVRQNELPKRQVRGDRLKASPLTRRWGAQASGNERIMEAMNKTGLDTLCMLSLCAHKAKLE